VLVVAGWSLNNARPRVWDKTFPEYYLPNLQAIMVSYAEFHQKPARRQKAMEHGLHAVLGVPKDVKIFLDNGSFHFISRDGEVPRKDYEEFIANAKPDWYPIPQDYIPIPKMSLEEQQECFRRTMQVNRKYDYDGYTPVIHVGQFLEKYSSAVKKHEKISLKERIALGGIVPNLLRASKALPHEKVIKDLKHIRKEFADKEMHVFGIGGTATLHIAALLKIDSVDSSGWRARAARGIVQLLGRGDRSVADLGKWKGRKPSLQEWQELAECQCPACQANGLDGLKADKIEGFCNRATHNLWILLEEARLIKHYLDAGTYVDWYERHLENSTYKRLIQKIAWMSMTAISAN
jgi:queuine/archaeosine tRNA-ribosyltransferase